MFLLLLQDYYCRTTSSSSFLSSFHLLLAPRCRVLSYSCCFLSLVVVVVIVVVCTVLSFSSFYFSYSSSSSLSFSSFSNSHISHAVLISHSRRDYGRCLALKLLLSSRLVLHSERSNISLSLSLASAVNPLSLYIYIFTCLFSLAHERLYHKGYSFLADAAWTNASLSIFHVRSHRWICILFLSLT